MPTYEMEIPSIAETQLTGYYGSSIVGFRGQAYRSEFRADGHTYMRNGVVVEWSTLPQAVKRHAIGVHLAVTSPHKA